MDIPLFSIINWTRKFINWNEMKRIPYIINQFRSPIKVVVYGESGVGKTQFVNTITMSHEYAKSRTRDISRGHILKLSNGRRVELIDIPGQSSYIQKRASLVNLYKKGEIKGVINIVAYGYLAKPETRENEAFKIGTDIIKPKFLRDNLKLELKQTKEWIELVSNNKNVEWVMHIINKADLWYDKEQAVTEYYELHDYRRDVIDPLSPKRRWKLLHYCSTMTSFLKHHLPHAIDEEMKEMLHKNLMKELEELALRSNNGKT